MVTAHHLFGIGKSLIESSKFSLSTNRGYWARNFIIIQIVGWDEPFLWGRLQGSHVRHSRLLSWPMKICYHSFDWVCLVSFKLRILPPKRPNIQKPPPYKPKLRLFDLLCVLQFTVPCYFNQPNGFWSEIREHLIESWKLSVDPMETWSKFWVTISDDWNSFRKSFPLVNNWTLLFNMPS